MCCKVVIHNHMRLLRPYTRLGLKHYLVQRENDLMAYTLHQFSWKNISYQSHFTDVCGSVMKFNIKIF